MITRRFIDFPGCDALPEALPSSRIREGLAVRVREWCSQATVAGDRGWRSDSRRDFGDVAPSDGHTNGISLPSPEAQPGWSRTLPGFGDGAREMACRSARHGHGGGDQSRRMLCGSSLPQ